MGIKYKVDENFFSTWSRKSAYVIGFIFADGNLENAEYIRGKYVRFTNTDLSLIEHIKKALESAHKIVITPASGNRKEKYLLRIGSHKIYNDLKNLGLHPRKSLNMKFPDVPKEILSDFIRGYFDGDGTIAFERMKNRSNNRLVVIFTSGSKDFLIGLTKILSKVQIVAEKKIYNSRRSYQLRYRSREAIAVLNFIYDKIEDDNPLFLQRKYDRYNELISSPDKVRCGNLFNKKSRIWNYGLKRRRTQVA